ncbi:hypothetical protein ES708_21608 [subsurface metagenome]
MPSMAVRSRVLRAMESQLGCPTARPLEVACEECSHTAPLRATVERMKATALRKLRFVEVVLGEEFGLVVS